MKVRFARVQPWLSLAVRLVAGAIMIWAGTAKMLDLSASVRAVRAYEILPEAIVPAFGNALPFVEIAVGFFLIAGLFTRAASVVYLAMLAAFVFGTLWAWGHGLDIDCGCFGGDGSLAEGESSDYSGHLWQRAGFVALGAWLLAYPRSALSLDSFLRRGGE